MKNWKSYIIAKLDSNVWGGIILDYYSKREHKESESISSEDFINWIIEDISPHCNDLIKFHQVFLVVMVRLFGKDIDKAMQGSIALLKRHKAKINPSLCQTFACHYNEYKVMNIFKILLNKDLGMTLPEEEQETTEQLVRICHISDLHFGFHHELIGCEGIDCEFHKTDLFINFLREEVRNKRKIDLLIVSGDITSIAADDEYAQFIDFVEEIKRTNVMPQDNFYNRILLVPGNHEARRGDNNGRADYLNNFKEFVEKMRSEGIALSTPYSIEKKDHCVIRKESKENIPYAMHEYPLLKVRVLTLVSSYYSQGIDEKVLGHIANYEKLKDDWKLSSDAEKVYNEIGKYFQERIWLDKGVFSPDYYGVIQSELYNYFENHKEPDFLNIAVAHHNATVYFQITGALYPVFSTTV